MTDLTPSRLARLRTWATRHDANRPDIDGCHEYDGACPWCRADHLQPGHDGYFDGNAHDLALELLDEIACLQHALERARLGWAATDVELKMMKPAARHAPAGDPVVDLMAALEESVAAAKEARSRRPRSGGEER